MVVVLAVAQGQPFGQVFGVGPAHAGEPCFPRREGAYLGIVPAASVAFVALPRASSAGFAAAPWWWLFRFGLQRQHQRIAFSADRRAVVVGQRGAWCDVQPAGRRQRQHQASAAQVVQQLSTSIRRPAVTGLHAVAGGGIPFPAPHQRHHVLHVPYVLLLRSILPAWAWRSPAGQDFAGLCPDIGTRLGLGKNVPDHAADLGRVPALEPDQAQRGCPAAAAYRPAPSGIGPGFAVRPVSVQAVE